MTSSTPERGFTRRALLIAGTTAATLGLVATRADAEGGELEKYRRRFKALRKRIRPGTRSANGWPVETAADAGGTIWTQVVPGTGVDVALAMGAPAVLLGYIVQRFHYDVRQLTQDDVVGFQEARRALGRHEGNHASGSAVDILALQLAKGSSDGYFASEERAIRSILSDLEGSVRWGGDLGFPDQSHFEITLGPDNPRLAALAQRLQGTAGLRP